MIAMATVSLVDIIKGKGKPGQSTKYKKRFQKQKNNQISIFVHFLQRFSQFQTGLNDFCNGDGKVGGKTSHHLAYLQTVGDGAHMPSFYYNYNVM